MGRIAQPEPYAVYTLRCESPTSVKTVEDRASRKIGDCPRYIYKAMNSWELFYVGSTGDIYNRISQHIQGGDEAAVFTAIFPPAELRDIEWHQNYTQAARREKQIAVELRQESDDGFVYQK